MLNWNKITTEVLCVEKQVKKGLRGGIHLSYALQMEPDDINLEEVYLSLLLVYVHKCIIMS